MNGRIVDKGGNTTAEEEGRRFERLIPDKKEEAGSDRKGVDRHRTKGRNSDIANLAINHRVSKACEVSFH